MHIKTFLDELSTNISIKGGSLGHTLARCVQRCLTPGTRKCCITCSIFSPVQPHGAGWFFEAETVLSLREVHGQTQVSTLNLKRHCSHCPKFNLPTIPAHLQVKSCPIKPSSETADAPESTRYFVVCFGLSASLSLHFWGLYRCDPGGIFNACDTVLKILRLKFVDRPKFKAY